MLEQMVQRDLLEEVRIDSITIIAEFVPLTILLEPEEEPRGC